ncbi:hypothetical protein WP50_22120 [Lactiplantibacillus plantarum]|nr:hypothetical protein WP50_22120 [Lactiplantibacillus plantarum]
MMTKERIIFSTKVLEIGAESADFKSIGMAVLFGDEAPDALRPSCFIIEVVPISEQITAGMKLEVDNQVYQITDGVFPHINPSEYFIWLGIAQGVQKLGLNTMDLAIRYLLVGLVMNFIGGWITDFTTAYVCKQQGITLSKKVEFNG